MDGIGAFGAFETPRTAAVDEYRKSQQADDLLDGLTSPYRMYYASIRSLPIRTLIVRRQPLAKFTAGLLQLLSLGTWKAAAARAGYDKFYHLSLAFQLRDGRWFLVEKNDVVCVYPITRVRDERRKQDGVQLQGVPVPPNITLSQLLNRALNEVGPDTFWVYRAFGNCNCQNFVRTVLDSSNILNPQIDAFVFQPVEGLADKLPSYFKDLTQKVTDTAAWARRLIGRGEMEEAAAEPPKDEKRENRARKRMLELFAKFEEAETAYKAAKDYHDQLKQTKRNIVTTIKDSYKYDGVRRSREDALDRVRADINLAAFDMRKARRKLDAIVRDPELLELNARVKLKRLEREDEEGVATLQGTSLPAAQAPRLSGKKRKYADTVVNQVNDDNKDDVRVFNDSYDYENVLDYMKGDVGRLVHAKDIADSALPMYLGSEEAANSYKLADIGSTLMESMLGHTQRKRNALKDYDDKKTGQAWYRKQVAKISKPLTKAQKQQKKEDMQNAVYHAEYMASSAGPSEPLLFYTRHLKDPAEREKLFEMRAKYKPFSSFEEHAKRKVKFDGALWASEARARRENTDEARKDLEAAQTLRRKQKLVYGYGALRR